MLIVCVWFRARIREQQLSNIVCSSYSLCVQKNEALSISRARGLNSISTWTIWNESVCQYNYNGDIWWAHTSSTSKYVTIQFSRKAKVRWIWQRPVVVVAKMLATKSKKTIVLSAESSARWNARIVWKRFIVQQSIKRRIGNGISRIVTALRWVEWAKGRYAF